MFWEHQNLKKNSIPKLIIYGHISDNLLSARQMLLKLLPRSSRRCFLRVEKRELSYNPQKIPLWGGNCKSGLASVRILLCRPFFILRPERRGLLLLGA